MTGRRAGRQLRMMRRVITPEQIERDADAVRQLMNDGTISDPVMEIRRDVQEIVHPDVYRRRREISADHDVAGLSPDVISGSIIPSIRGGPDFVSSILSVCIGVIHVMLPLRFSDS